jgi:hypothetical protein
MPSPILGKCLGRVCTDAIFDALAEMTAGTKSAGIKEAGKKGQRQFLRR